MGLPGLGNRIRTFRKREKMTQAALASKLGISASYLNLMEHDKRSVTAAVLIQVAQIFEVDLQSFGEESSNKTMSELTEVFSDDLFENHNLSIAEVREFAAQSPEVARAVVTMYDTLLEAKEQIDTLSTRMGDHTLPGVETWRLPPEEVNDLLQRNQNFFPSLEKAAVFLRRKANIDPNNVYGSLVSYLESAHGITVQIIESQPDTRTVRKYLPERKLILLSEVLDTSTMSFQLAHQIGLLETSQVLDVIASDRHITTDESRALAKVAMANYFAGAVLMPYDEFLAAAEAERYDIDILSHRFRTSFEQVCHRLTTMRKPGSEGIAFHFLRVDIAGNISKRFSASGIQFARFSGTCPRWNIGVAFMTPGQIRMQISRMLDGGMYFCVARTVSRGERGFHAPPAFHAVALGCQLEDAPRMVYSDGIDLQDQQTVVPVGVTCKLCERRNCEQRAFPPVHKKLHIDENVRGITFYASIED